MNGNLINRIENEVEQRRINAAVQRMMRDNSNPFDLPEDTFRKMYRLSREAANHVFTQFSAHLDAPRRSTKIPPVVKILSTDPITQQVCMQCCNITIKMFKFRTRSLKHDRELREKYALLKRNQKIIVLDDSSPTPTTSKIETNLKPLDPPKKGIKRVHPSIIQMKKENPNIKFPPLTMDAHYKPYITLLTDEVEEWFAERNISSDQLEELKQEALEISKIKSVKKLKEISIDEPMSISELATRLCSPNNIKITPVVSSFSVASVSNSQKRIKLDTSATLKTNFSMQTSTPKELIPPQESVSPVKETMLKKSATSAVTRIIPSVSTSLKKTVVPSHTVQKHRTQCVPKSISKVNAASERTNVIKEITPPTVSLLPLSTENKIVPSVPTISNKIIVPTGEISISVKRRANKGNNEFLSTSCSSNEAPEFSSKPKEVDHVNVSTNKTGIPVDTMKIAKPVIFQKVVQNDESPGKLLEPRKSANSDSRTRCTDGEISVSSYKKPQTSLDVSKNIGALSAVVNTKINNQVHIVGMSSFQKSSQTVDTGLVKNELESTLQPTSPKPKVPTETISIMSTLQPTSSALKLTTGTISTMSTLQPTSSNPKVTTETVSTMSTLQPTSSVPKLTTETIPAMSILQPTSSTSKDTTETIPAMEDTDSGTDGMEVSSGYAASDVSSDITSRSSSVMDNPFDIVPTNRSNSTNLLDSSLLSHTNTSHSLLTCKTCDSVHYTLKDLKIHQRRKHTKCAFCKSRFKSVSAKDYHVKFDCVMTHSAKYMKELKIVLTKVDEIDAIRKQYTSAFASNAVGEVTSLQNNDLQTNVNEAVANTPEPMVDNSKNDDNCLDVICISDEEGDSSTSARVKDVRPKISIKNNDILNVIDIRDSDSNIMKKILKQLSTPMEQALAAADIPSNNAITEGANRKTQILKNLRKHLYSYKIPIEIQYGEKLRVQYRYNPAPVHPKKQDLWNHLTPKDLYNSPKPAPQVAKVPVQGKVAVKLGTLSGQALTLNSGTGLTVPTSSSAVKNTQNSPKVKVVPSSVNKVAIPQFKVPPTPIIVSTTSVRPTSTSLSNSSMMITIPTTTSSSYPSIVINGTHGLTSNVQNTYCTNYILVPNGLLPHITNNAPLQVSNSVNPMPIVQTMPLISSISPSNHLNTSLPNSNSNMVFSRAPLQNTLSVVQTDQTQQGIYKMPTVALSSFSQNTGSPPITQSDSTDTNTNVGIRVKNISELS